MVDVNDERHGWLGRRVTIKDSGSPKQYKVVALSSLGDSYVLLSRDDILLQQAFSVTRLERVPEPQEQADGQKTPAAKGYLNSDSFNAKPDEALEWFVFVMIQADMLFQLASEDKDEMVRLMVDRGMNPNGPGVTAAIAYFENAAEWYAADRERD